jgi:hypothetical protein
MALIAGMLGRPHIYALRFGVARDISHLPLTILTWPLFRKQTWLGYNPNFHQELGGEPRQNVMVLLLMQYAKGVTQRIQGLMVIG